MRHSATCERRAAAPRDGERGFSLIEVMAAVAIMAAALIVLYQNAAQSRRAAAYLEDHLGARLIARSLIEDVRQSPLTNGDRREGDSGRYHWQLVIEPVNVPGLATPRGMRFYHLQATVAWPPGGSFVLDALKLGK